MKIFEALRYANMLQVLAGDGLDHSERLPGMQPIPMLYQQHMFQPGTLTVKPELVEAIKQEKAPVVLNVETFDATPNNYIDIIKQVYRSGNVGFYGRVPDGGYWPAVLNTLTGQHSSILWKRKSESIASIVPYVGAVYPSLYTYYNDQAGWKTAAIAKIAEARRVAPGKPVYAFINPWFQSNNPSLVGQQIPKDFFKMELTVAGTYADGVVIWDYQPTVPFTEAMPWYQAFLEFKAQGGLEL